MSKVRVHAPGWEAAWDVPRTSGIAHRNDPSPRRSDDGTTVAADTGSMALGGAGGTQLPVADGRAARLDLGRLLLRGGPPLAGAVLARRAGPARHRPGVLRGAAHGADFGRRSADRQGRGTHDHADGRCP